MMENAVIHPEQSEKSAINIEQAARSTWMTEFSVTLLAVNSVYLILFSKDVNDNRPTFERDTFEITVAENLSKDSQILPLNAVDLDRGKNGRLLYEMVEAGPEVTEYVGLLPNSGILFLKKELDYEKAQSMEFAVQERILPLPKKH
jgi:hypothetical protein